MKLGKFIGFIRDQVLTVTYLLENHIFVGETLLREEKKILGRWREISILTVF